MCPWWYPRTYPPTTKPHPFLQGARASCAFLNQRISVSALVHVNQLTACPLSLPLSLFNNSVIAVDQGGSVCSCPRNPRGQASTLSLPPSLRSYNTSHDETSMLHVFDALVGKKKGSRPASRHSSPDRSYDTYIHPLGP